MMKEKGLIRYLYRKEAIWAFCLLCSIFVIGTGLSFQVPWVAWDALDYINAAENIYSGKGIVNGWQSDNYSNYWPLTVWPPFYPILIAACMTLGFSSVNAAMWVTILSFLGVVLISFFIGKELGSPVIGYLAALCCLVLESLWQLSRWALTEMPFIFFSLITILLLMRFSSERKLPLLILAAIFCGLAAITRFMGVTMIISGVILLLLGLKEQKFIKLKNTLIFGLIASIPIGLVFLRNVWYTGHISGANRGGGSGDITGVISDFIIVFITDFNPCILIDPNPFGPKVIPESVLLFNIIPALLFGLFLIAIFVALYRDTGARFRGVINDYLKKSAILLIYLIVYLISLIILEFGMGDIATVQTRYLLPVYPVLILILISIIHHGYLNIRGLSSQRLILGFSVLIFICFIITHASASIPVIGEKGGREYTAPTWYDDDPEEYEWVLDNIPDGAEILSNNPRPLQLHISRLTHPLPKQDDESYALKVLRVAKPGFMIISFQGEKANREYMDADMLFRYNAQFAEPAQYRRVFANDDASVYLITQPAR